MRNILRATALAGSMLAASVAAAQMPQTAAPDAIIADIRDNSLSAEEIRGMPSIDQLSVVSLDHFAGSDLQQLQDILLNTEDGFAEVRTAIEANEVFEVELRQREADISEVHAATIDGTGDVTLYTNVPSR